MSERFLLDLGRLEPDRPPRPVPTTSQTYLTHPLTGQLVQHPDGFYAQPAQVGGYSFSVSVPVGTELRVNGRRVVDRNGKVAP